MGTPEIIMLVIYGLNIVFAVANHGKARGKCNGFAAIAGAAIGIGLLYWGGFFA